MDKPFFVLTDSREREGVAFVFLLILLSIDSAANVTVGFSMPIFLSTVVLADGLAFLYPRAGLAAAISVTILFERFFTLVPMSIGEATYKLYPLDLILVATFASSVLLRIRDGGRRLRLRFTDLLLLTFFIIVTGIFIGGALGLGRDIGLATAFSTWKNYVFYGMTYFAVVAFVRTKEDLMTVGRMFLGTVAIGVSFLFIGLVRGGGLWTEYTPLSTPGTRFLAFPHAFSYSLAFLTVLLYFPFRAEGKTWQSEKYRYFVLVVLLFAGILGSLMRHLWIGIAVTLFTAVASAPVRIGRPLGRYFLAVAFPVVTIAILSVALFASLPENVVGDPVGDASAIVRERVLSIGSGTDESLAWREAVWKSALSRFSEHPFRGIGFGASVPVELGEYRQYVEVRNMHNSWLALLIQTGIFGTVAFAAFLVSLVRGSFQSGSGSAFIRGSRTVLTGLLLFQGIVFFSQPYLETNLLGIFFWVTLGLLRSLSDMRDTVS